MAATGLLGLGSDPLREGEVIVRDVQQLAEFLPDTQGITISPRLVVKNGKLLLAHEPEKAGAIESGGVAFRCGVFEQCNGAQDVSLSVEHLRQHIEADEIIRSVARRQPGYGLFQYCSRRIQTPFAISDDAFQYGLLAVVQIAIVGKVIGFGRRRLEPRHDRQKRQQGIAGKLNRCQVRLQLRDFCRSKQ